MLTVLKVVSVLFFLKMALDLPQFEQALRIAIARLCHDGSLGGQISVPIVDHIFLSHFLKLHHITIHNIFSFIFPVERYCSTVSTGAYGAAEVPRRFLLQINIRIEQTLEQLSITIFLFVSTKNCFGLAATIERHEKLWGVLEILNVVLVPLLVQRVNITDK